MRRYNLITPNYTQEVSCDDILEHITEALKQGITITMGFNIYSVKTDYEEEL